MDCRKIDELIRERDLGDLSPAVQRELDAHLNHCTRCRLLVQPDLCSEPLEPPKELLRAILRQTSGPACGRAATLLALRIDGATDALDDRLAEAHADDCGSCNQLRIVFQRLAVDLPAMCELEPDAAFADRVLALTTRHPDRAAFAGFGRFWSRLVQRPRLAWELAYVGAMLAWLILGAPFAALPETPPDVRAAVQSVREPVTSLGRQFWNSARENWSSSITRIETDLERRSARTGEPRRKLKQHGTDLRSALESHDVAQSRRAMKEITVDARDLVNRFIHVDSTDRRQP